MNLKETPYYIGLDCGTNSIGFAVTDKSYNLLKAQHKDMWGSHLFDEANTAKARRSYRNARKRLNRRNERIKLLQALFAEEMAKVDPTFFLRLNESSLYPEDRSKNNQQHFSIFNDKDYTDKEFKQDFPTIYHLRAALIDNDKQTTKTGHDLHDIRFVYLALHHAVKNRGHFLFPGENTTIQNIGDILKALQESYEAIFSASIDDENSESAIISFTSNKEIEEALKIAKRAERIDKLNQLISANDDKVKKELIKAMVGYSVKITNLFKDDENEYAELPKLEFTKASFEEEDLPKLEDSLSEDEYKLVESLKALYDYSLLANIMKGEQYISKAKVKQYDKNNEDLQRLKRVIRKYANDKFYEFFYSDNDKSGTFSNYIGSINSDKLKNTDGKVERDVQRRAKRISTDNFHKAIKNILKDADKEDADVKAIMNDIDNDSFYTLLRSFRNGIVPYQVNKLDLAKILDNAKSYLPWLDIKGEDGLTAIDKITSIMKYRIPYYVGPLTASDMNRNAWLVRKEDGKILPWNFYKKVDEKGSANAFITRMTNKCTYLPGEDVVPKQSLLYQSYMVLDEINNLRFNNEEITVNQKQTIYNELFENGTGNITQKTIKQLAVAHSWIRKGEELNLTGIDTTIKSSLSSYRKFKPYMDEGKLTKEDVDNIIRRLTIFSDGGKMAEDYIRTNFSTKLTDDEVKQISRFKFSGWGKFSKKFLTGIEAINPETGEYENIIRLLWDTNYNLKELISNKETGIPEQLNPNKEIKKIDYSILDELRLSPKVKRQIWQALRIEQEIEHIMGHKPERIFIEMTRYQGEKGKRTKTRKDQLKECISSKEDKEIYESLSNQPAEMITKRDKLYLYYTQLGKCMYTGEPIDLDDLLGESRLYDIDHIYPYSKSNDNSLENKVIVKSKLNREKTNAYPIQEDIRNKMKPFWQKLLDKKLISSEKFKRLTRNTSLSEEDLKGFINRQIVETSQSTKAIATILRQYLGDDGKVIYSKAGNVSDFRKEFELPKSRVLNHLHHAKDAYLNIVVGNTLHTKYTAKWFLMGLNSNNPEKGRIATFKYPYKYNVEGAWIVDNNETISIVKETMNKNTVLFTRQPEMRTGQLFDLNLVKKGSKQGIIPAKIANTQLEKQLKNAKPNEKEAIIKAWTDKYGGYNSIEISHFALVKHLEKKKYVYTFVRIPIIRAKELLVKENLIKYCEEELGYKDINIVKAKVLKNTKILINGYLVTIANSYDAGRLRIKSAVPLLLDNVCTCYVKKLENFSKRKEKEKNPIITEKDGITKEQNLMLYNILESKAYLYIYQRRPSNCPKKIASKKDVFKNLSCEQQVDVLMNIIKYFAMEDGKTDLSLLGESSKSGLMTHSITINPLEENATIIFQSITGIYEERLELK